MHDLQPPTESELDSLFEAMYDDYFGGQPSANVENVPPAQEPQVRQTSTASTTRLGHNLFSIGQFYDSGLEVAFRRNACFVRNLEGVDLLKRDRSTKLYTINLYEMASTSPICLMARVSSTSLGFDLTYAPSTITTQQPSEGKLDLLFEAMYDDYIGGQPSTTARPVLAAQAQQVRQTSMASTSIADTAPTPTNSSFLATNFPITSQDVDELNLQQQHVLQQGNQAHLQSTPVADNVLNDLFDGNMFVNPFAIPSTSAA
nr:integrase, catalytic region, zinc finger, CCHC-type, peptidase aspartic, catalytic [Tanacetum cinerariifolium]